VQEVVSSLRRLRVLLCPQHIRFCGSLPLWATLKLKTKRKRSWLP
jgi:hypothetical protein